MNSVWICIHSHYFPLNCITIISKIYPSCRFTTLSLTIKPYDNFPYNPLRNIKNLSISRIKSSSKIFGYLYMSLVIFATGTKSEFIIKISDAINTGYPINPKVACGLMLVSLSTLAVFLIQAS